MPEGGGEKLHILRVKNCNAKKNAKKLHKKIVRRTRAAFVAGSGAHADMDPIKTTHVEAQVGSFMPVVGPVGVLRRLFDLRHALRSGKGVVSDRSYTGRI